MAVIIEGIRCVQNSPVTSLGPGSHPMPSPRQSSEHRADESDYPALPAHHKEGETGANVSARRSLTGRLLSKSITEKTERAPCTYFRAV